MFVLSLYREANNLPTGVCQGSWRYKGQLLMTSNSLISLPVDTPAVLRDLRRDGYAIAQLPSNSSFSQSKVRLLVARTHRSRHCSDSVRYQRDFCRGDVAPGTRARDPLLPSGLNTGTRAFPHKPVLCRIMAWTPDFIASSPISLRDARMMGWSFPANHEI